KVLKEHPVQVDQKLESLFLGVSDTLKVLLEHLSGPFGLSEEAANTLMLETEPVFTWLYEHLELLVQQSNGEAENNSHTTEIEPNSADSVTTLIDLFVRTDDHEEEDSESTFPESSGFIAENSPVTAPRSDHWNEFQTQALQALREMLQLFKQQTTPESRNNLQQCCQQLVSLGQTWSLPHWCRLCQAAANAIANPENTYLVLAKIIITEVKQAQELVLQHRETEIVVSEQLTALLNLPALDLLAHQPVSVTNANLSAITDSFTSQSTVLQPTDSITSLTELSEQLHPSQDASAATENNVPEIAATFNLFLDAEEDRDLSSLDHNGPEVGLAELNSLADLFEGDTPELDNTWQQEENLDINVTSELGIDVSDSNVDDYDSDLADFLFFDEDKSDNDLHISLTTTEELNQLFGKNFAESEQPNRPTSAAVSREAEMSVADINDNDLMDELLTSISEDNELVSSGELTQLETISSHQKSSFDELFSDTDNVGIEEVLQDKNGEEHQTIIQPESLTLDALFDDFDDTPQISNDDSEIADLFDITPVNDTETTQIEDNLNDFWNEETITEDTASILEQDVEKALEESLFAAAASDIFGNIEELNTLPSTNVNLGEEDLIFSLDTDDEDDLFANLVESNFISPSNEDDLELSLEEISDFSQEPEALDFIPEFTQQPLQIAATDQLDNADILVEDEELLVAATPENAELPEFQPDLDLAEISIDSTFVDDVDHTETNDLFAAETEQPAINLEESLVAPLDYSENESNLESSEEILDNLLNTEATSLNQQLILQENVSFVLPEEEETTVTAKNEPTADI
ncbi:two-component hybrid sensor and regulator, partial [Nodularia sp. UHCC 0506]|nr:two-component hybrid sensor and regulator [Nodularia sp. UHCC 0506]